MVILEENFKWHLEAFASELYIYCFSGLTLRCCFPPYSLYIIFKQ